MKNNPLKLAVLLALALNACSDNDGPDNDAAEGQGDLGKTADAGADRASRAFTVTGRVVSLADGSPAGQGLCAEVADPSPAVSGAPPTTLGTGTVGTDSTFSIEASGRPAIGIVVSVSDCPGQETTAMRTGTGILAAAYADLPAGGSTAEQVVYSIPSDFEAAIASSLLAAGYSGTLADDGVFIVSVLDHLRQPVSGARVSFICSAPPCDSEPVAFYIDDDPIDGLFTTGATTNTETDASAGALVFIPKGPVGPYGAEDGGVHSWRPIVFGTIAGLASIAAFTAQPPST